MSENTTDLVSNCSITDGPQGTSNNGAIFLFYTPENIHFHFQLSEQLTHYFWLLKSSVLDCQQLLVQIAGCMMP